MSDETQRSRVNQFDRIDMVIVPVLFVVGLVWGLNGFFETVVPMMGVSDSVAVAGMITAGGCAFIGPAAYLWARGYNLGDPDGG